MDFRICQTSTAFPAKPGGLPLTLGFFSGDVRTVLVVLALADVRIISRILHFFRQIDEYENLTVPPSYAAFKYFEVVGIVILEPYFARLFTQGGVLFPISDDVVRKAVGIKRLEEPPPSWYIAGGFVPFEATRGIAGKNDREGVGIGQTQGCSQNAGLELC